MRKLSWKRLAISLVTLALILPAATAAGAPVRNGPVEALLVSELTSITPGTPFTIGLLLRMDPDWHVYWKNPGDSGLPTTLEWSLPPGFAAKPLQWPIPDRIVQQDLATYGYSREVLLPVEILPPRTLAAGTVVTLKARAGWLACRVECTPGSAELSLAMPVAAAGAAPDSRWSGMFKAARARLPVSDPSLTVSAFVEGNRIALTAQGSTVNATRALFFPAAAGTIRDSASQESTVSGSRLTLRLVEPEKAAFPRRLTGILVLSGPGTDRAIEVDAAIEPGATRAGVSAAAGPAAGAAGFLLALILAFAGGILLNLMPCVLPVLSLKVMSFLRSAEGGQNATGYAGTRSPRTPYRGRGNATEYRGRGSLRHGLLYSAGVLVSFWIIAGILVALRAGGQFLGWGFQFQDPVVVAVTAAVFFLVGLNLFGVFEVGSSITALAARAGGRPAGGSPRGYGSFVSGLFATAVATPCTAPFMGGALGYALARPAPVAFGIFTALALGLAAPYLLLSAFPRLVSRLPRPGRWMETLRQLMGFPMMGAVIWMIFVLEALSGAGGVIALLSALLAAGLGAWVWGRWGGVTGSRGTRIVAACVAVALALGGPGAASAFLHASAPRGSAAEASAAAGESLRADPWQPWTPEKVAQLHAQGVPVFVDFTARWCITCQVNERVALENASVRERFRSLGVTTLRADWTDRSDLIARTLADRGRAGVPLYLFYAPGAVDPVILPEVLTPGIVLAALGPAR